MTSIQEHLGEAAEPEQPQQPAVTHDVRNKLPPGFSPPPPPEYAPNLPYDRFTGGVVAYFIRTREPGGRAKNCVHSFADKGGEEFDVWGCASLDAQLDSARKGQKVFMQYEGKRLNDDKNEVHAWVVGLG